MKKLLLSFFAVIMLVGFMFVPSTAYQGNTIVSVDGNAVTFPDAKPFIGETGMPYIPIRFVAEAMGASVDWNEQAQEVNIRKGNTSITVRINDSIIKVNSYTNSMEAAAILEAGRTFVPIGRIAEALGAKAGWNIATQTVAIASVKSVIDPSSLEKLEYLSNSEQAVIITADSLDNPFVIVHTFEKEGDKWKEYMPPFPGVVGNKGLTYDKAEGDKKSPIGVFPVIRCFSRYKNLGTKLEFTQFKRNEFWVDDKDSEFYQNSASEGRWNSAENLYDVGEHYKYFVVIEYNTENIVPGKGSGINLCIWGGQDVPTSGSTAIAKNKLVQIIKWLDPSKSPVIVQGIESELDKIK